MGILLSCRVKLELCWSFVYNTPYKSEAVSGEKYKNKVSVSTELSVNEHGILKLSECGKTFKVIRLDTISKDTWIKFYPILLMWLNLADLFTERGQTYDGDAEKSGCWLDSYNKSDTHRKCRLWGVRTGNCEEQETSPMWSTMIWSYVSLWFIRNVIWNIYHVTSEGEWKSGGGQLNRENYHECQMWSNILWYARRSASGSRFSPPYTIYDEE